MELTGPFLSVLNTNYAPTSLEIAELRLLLEEPKKKLLELNEEIFRLQKTLESLVSERDKVQSYIDAHAALISPLRRLPAETLTEIFLHCLPAHRIPSMNINEAPLLLTRITRHWRDVALASPRLWCAIHVYIRSGSRKQITEVHLRQQQLRMETWLSRSGSLPLTISLNMDTGSPYQGFPPLNFDPLASHMLLIKYIKSLSLRWKRVELKVHPTALILLDVLRPEDVPQLKTLVIDRNFLHPGQPWHSEHGLATSFPDFTAALSLQKMGLLGFRKGRQSFYLPQATYSILTELTLRSDPGKDSLASNEALDLLARLPKLRLCNLSVLLLDPPNTHGNKSSIYLPFLHDITLNFGLPRGENSSARLMSEFLAQLSIVSLRNLAIYAKPISIYPSPFTELPFLSLPLDDLEHLTIAIPLSSEILINCLKLIPKLTSLRVHDLSMQVLLLNNQGAAGRTVSVLQDMHLALLSPSNGISPLCPHLRSILFTNCSNVSDAAICDLAQARWSFDRRQYPEMQQLESLRVAVSNRVEDGTQVCSRLLKLREEGMDIRVRYHMHNSLASVMQEYAWPRGYPLTSDYDYGYIVPCPFDDTAEFRPVRPILVDLP